MSTPSRRGFFSTLATVIGAGKAAAAVNPKPPLPPPNPALDEYLRRVLTRQVYDPDLSTCSRRAAQILAPDFARAYPLYRNLYRKP